MVGSLSSAGRRALAAAALSLLLGCERVDEAGEPGPETNAPRATQLREPIVLDLSERFDAADIQRLPGSENLCGPEANVLLSSGWHAWDDAEPRGADRGAGAGRRWSGPRNAVVEVPIVKPRDATLYLDLEPVRSLRLAPPQQLRVVWNGRERGTHALDGRTKIELALPSSEQRIGPNRLELQPNSWLGPGFHAYPEDRRTLGIACRRIALIPRADAPEHGPRSPFVEGGRIVQPPDSVVTFQLALPREARLVGLATPRGGTLGSAARIAVSALGRAGEARGLAAAEIGVADPGADPVAISADLSALGGEMAGLSFAFSSAPGAGGAPDLVWQELRIEGVSAAATLASSEAIPRRPYNIFILMLDSLRADHVEPYGAEGVRTPHLARLAAQGVTFLGARSNASWTRPAVASLLTSLSPSAHGVQEMEERLSPHVPFLPVMLRKRGYRTVAVTANAVIAPAFGFGRGFQQVHRHFALVKGGKWEKRHRTPEARARFVWNRYLGTLGRDAKRPFFVYLHEIDPHSPYEPEAPYDALYDFGYRGNITLDLATIGRIRDEPSWAEPMDIRYLNARYRGEVSFMDDYVGWILDKLEAEGLAEHTLFVLVSDHGEEFMEHRSVGHAHSVYEELLRVPLILRLPGALPADLRLDVGAQLIDLPPTILDLIGEPVPVWMEGESLLPYLTAPHSERPPRPSFASSNGPRHTTVRLGRWKLIRDEPKDPETPRRHWLFDLESDPGETVDLWARELVVGHTLRQLLDAKLERDAARRGGPTERVERGELDADVLDGLRALGYVE